MPFTPNFDQPNNTEIQEYRASRTKQARDKKINDIVSEIDYTMAAEKKYEVSIVGFLLDNDKEVCDCIRSIYIGVGWSDVKFKQKISYTTTITLVK